MRLIGLLFAAVLMRADCIVVSQRQLDHATLGSNQPTVLFGYPENTEFRNVVLTSRPNGAIQICADPVLLPADGPVLPWHGPAGSPPAHTVPEINPAALTAGVALLAGMLLCLRGRGQRIA